jgi:hypothetical protein
MSEAQVVTLWGGEGARTPYMTRVILGRFRVHVFHRGDVDPDCHDHPADFWTFPLVSYVEEYVRADGGLAFRVVKAFRFHRRSAEFAHRVIGRWTGEWFNADAGQIATLAWWGKKRRDWGFHTARGWVPWRIYTDTPEAA